jgi:phosphopantothenoylcysteine decarboxylase/phosphopantothenate--cysteine ligase
MRKVVLGVSGSIAAYKACDFASKLVQAGHEVDVVMTHAATRFVRPLSFSALTHREVFTDRRWGEGSMPHDHLTLVEQAEAFVVAPCTANLIGKFAHGIADDVMSATWLAATCPKWIAPAMNFRMWENARVQANVEILKGDGVHLLGPDSGYLAEAETGPGRMCEVAAMMAVLEEAWR